MTSSANACILTKPLSIRLAMSSTTTLSSKFQISIPKAVREEQQWQSGQQFVFIPKGKGMLLMPVPELAALHGLAQGAKTHHIRDRKDRF
jgi:AbrB family looped-hinge helix DNA binding protein